MFTRWNVPRNKEVSFIYWKKIKEYKEHKFDVNRVSTFYKSRNYTRFAQNSYFNL
jgi:hypothetical protein